MLKFVTVVKGRGRTADPLRNRSAMTLPVVRKLQTVALGDLLEGNVNH